MVSGIEPVDELMGGLNQGELYLVHGEASGKSLFGFKFLIEGLKKGENGALVIRYSPEDAVRRFARLGYDCLEDVYSGRLVILEYSDDISVRGMVVGFISSGVLGAIFGMLFGCFLGMSLSAWWQASSQHKSTEAALGCIRLPSFPRNVTPELVAEFDAG